jgi:hypothetical protein
VKNEYDEEIDDLAQANKSRWEEVRNLVLHAGLAPDPGGSVEIWDKIVRVLKSAERFLLGSAVRMACRAPSAEFEAHVRSDIQAELCSLMTDLTLFRMTETIADAPSGAGGAVGAVFTMMLRSTPNGEKHLGAIGKLAQLIVLYGRNRRQMARIAELEAEIAALKADAKMGAEPPSIQMPGAKS